MVAGQGKTATTCGEEYWDAYTYCNRTGCNESTKVVKTLEHNMVAGEGKTATICGEEYWDAYTYCDRAGCDESTKEVNVLDHDRKAHNALAPTCTDPGHEAYETCKREGCDYNTIKILAALDHEWNDGEVTEKATYVSKGKITYTCVRGCTKTEDIPMLIAAKVNGLDDEPKTGDLMIPAVLVLAVFGAGACLLTRKRAV